MKIVRSFETHESATGCPALRLGIQMTIQELLGVTLGISRASDAGGYIYKLEFHIQAVDIRLHSIHSKFQDNSAANLDQGNGGAQCPLCHS